MTLPALFVAHGAPDLPYSTTPARGFLEGLAERLPTPRAIVIISAHWEEGLNTIGTALNPSTIYDFGGFDPRLRQLTYPARTDAGVIDALGQALTTAGIPYRHDPARGFDHGVWVPLMLIWPDADIPVIQLSLRYGASAAENMALGRALAPLRDQGVLIVGSGAVVHNLRGVLPEGSQTPSWAADFDGWIAQGITSGDADTLAQFPAVPATARLAHPTPEHLMPLYVVMGAGGLPGRAIHRSFSLGSLGMASYAFGETLDGRVAA